MPASQITEAGIRNNISVALQYVDNWLRGLDAVAIFNLMEDAAAAEISRSQLWQWIHNEAITDDGKKVTAERYRQYRDEELEKLGGISQSRLKEATEILDNLILNDRFVEFLTIPAYEKLVQLNEEGVN